MLLHFFSFPHFFSHLSLLSFLPLSGSSFLHSSFNFLPRSSSLHGSALSFIAYSFNLFTCFPPGSLYILLQSLNSSFLFFSSSFINISDSYIPLSFSLVRQTVHSYFPLSFVFLVNSFDPLTPLSLFLLPPSSKPFILLSLFFRFSNNLS